MVFKTEIDGNTAFFGWEIEEYPRQFGKEPKAITESFSPLLFHD